MPSSDHSCIYSTMLFVNKLTEKHGIDPILTFDQPLFWKSMEIKLHEQHKGTFDKMVLLLGTFHTCMSFFGTIGYVMAGTGINALLELIYAEHTVPHILTGKAFSRATRAHLITSGVLSTLLVAGAYDVDLDFNLDEEEFVSNFHQRLSENENLFKLAQTMEKMLSGSATPDVMEKLEEDIASINDSIKIMRQKLEHDKTAQLWLTYMPWCFLYELL